MRRKGNKTQIKNFFLKHNIIQKSIQHPTENGVRQTANAVSKKLPCANFFERKIEKID
jgi:hypothetical protein